MEFDKIAALAMQGLLASYGAHDANTAEEIADDAMTFAHALQKELDGRQDMLEDIRQKRRQAEQQLNGLTQERNPNERIG